jgi:hypothetical protein
MRSDWHASGLGSGEYPLSRVLRLSVPLLQRVTLSWQSNRPLLRRGPLAPALLRGRAANGHQWPGAASAASMPRCPLRNTCARPPKVAIYVVCEISVRQKKRARAPRFDRSHAPRGSGSHDALRHRTRSVQGCIPTRERGNDQASSFTFDLHPRQPKHHKTRLGCRPNAGDA